jgi:hypothetical protein
MEEAQCSKIIIDRELTQVNIKEQCTIELEQLAQLMKEVDIYTKQIDTNLRKIHMHQQKILAIIRHEINITFSR